MIHDRPPKNWKRPAMPLAVKVEVLERALCTALGVDKIEYDHRPALWERHYDDEINNTIPGANNPSHIEVIGKAEHRKRTFGTKATSYGSDAHERAKSKRLEAAAREIKNAEIIARITGVKRQPFVGKVLITVDPKKRVWPKRKIPSRPFNRRKK